MRQESFKNGLAGEYLIHFPRYGVAINVLISREDIHIEDESQAAMRYFVVNAGGDLSETGRTILIDGGSRSVDFSYLENGVILKKGSRSGKYGGNNFERLIIDHFVSNNNVNEPNVTMIREALDSGLLQDGNSCVNIMDSITAAKKDIAKNIMRDLNGILDVMEVQARQINSIVFCGGLFKESKNDVAGSPSLYKYIEKMFMKYSQNTRFQRISYEFPIPYGLAFYRISLD
jgi:hypothetical protein